MLIKLDKNLKIRCYDNPKPRNFRAFTDSYKRLLIYIYIYIGKRILTSSMDLSPS
jgi:hypothetical protein